MQLQGIGQAVEINGGSTASSFNIALNGKAFKVLSDTLYSDKVGSIVRELSCNAFDSHVMAGKKEVPFVLHLPDDFEPWFSVTDFGIGLSEEAVYSVFTTYFQSTKDQSNDTIGAFGLGAKTPFSYTDQFTVTSVFDGVKSIYSAFISETGIPNIMKMHESAVQECNGVEIKMSVKKQDFTKFREQAHKQLQYFEVKPSIVNGVVSFENNNIVIDTSNVRVESVRNSYATEVIILQGNVGYPLDLNNLEIYKELEGLSGFGSLREQLNARIILKFDIGQIGVTASREAVEYDKRTIANIKSKFEIAMKDVASEIKMIKEQTPTAWEFVCKMKENYFINKMSVALWKDDDKYAGLSCYAGELVYRVGDLRAVSAQKFNSPYVTLEGMIDSSYRFDKKLLSPVSLARPSLIAKIIYVDDAKNMKRKIKYYAEQHHDVNKVKGAILVVSTAIILTIPQVKELFGGCEDVIALSSIVLPKVQRDKTKVTTVKKPKIQVYEMQDVDDLEQRIGAWKSVDLADVTGDYVYFTFTSAAAKCSSDSAILNLKQLARAGLIPCLRFFAVRKEDTDKVQSRNEIWTYLQEKRKEILAKYNVEKHLNRSRAVQMLSALSLTEDEIQAFCKIAPNSKIAKHLLYLSSLQKRVVAESQLMLKIANIFGLYSSYNDKLKESVRIRIKKEVDNNPSLQLYSGFANFATHRVPFEQCMNHFKF